jgi:hypothetical protein
MTTIPDIRAYWLDRFPDVIPVERDMRAGTAVHGADWITPASLAPREVVHAPWAAIRCDACPGTATTWLLGHALCPECAARERVGTLYVGEDA